MIGDTDIPATERGEARRILHFSGEAPERLITREGFASLSFTKVGALVACQRGERERERATLLSCRAHFIGEIGKRGWGLVVWSYCRLGRQCET